MAAEIFRLTERYRSTLVFANSRRLVEKIARLMNEIAGKRIAYAHHGSLSKEIRLTVESRLKRGELKAIIATNSLELGIDVGELDLVVLIQTPFTISSAIQKQVVPVIRSMRSAGQSSFPVTVSILRQAQP